jgi:hypothetical protein
MRASMKGILFSVLVMSLSGAAFAQGAGAGGGRDAAAGHGGTGMETPNGSGTTESTSGASGANTTGKSGGMSHKHVKQKKAGAAPASEGGGK